jgi:hypothetical protein
VQRKEGRRKLEIDNLGQGRVPENDAIYNFVLV